MAFSNNKDEKVVAGFGDEWSRFDQSVLSASELSAMFDSYFKIFPWDRLSAEAVGFDMGCGSGRWAKCVAPHVKKLLCIDPSGEALNVARKNLIAFSNVEFMEAAVDTCPIADQTMDFGYSLGVLHHIPDTLAGICACTQKLKPGAPFLIYLYYAFDNRPFWYRGLWKASEFFRAIISKLPTRLRLAATDCIAFSVYWPLARIAYCLEKMRVNVKNFPLSVYAHSSFYTLRTDALDRFGTRLEKRFTKKQIQAMLEEAGLENISFNDQMPFWVAIGYKKN